MKKQQPTFAKGHENTNGLKELKEFAKFNTTMKKPNKIKKVKAVEIVGYAYMGKWNPDTVSRFVYRKRPNDKVTFVKVKITPFNSK